MHWEPQMNITSQDYKHSSILKGAPNDRMFPKVRGASNGSPVALQSFLVNLELP